MVYLRVSVAEGGNKRGSVGLAVQCPEAMTTGGAWAEYRGLPRRIPSRSFRMGLNHGMAPSVAYVFSRLILIVLCYEMPDVNAKERLLFLFLFFDKTLNLGSAPFMV